MVVITEQRAKDNVILFPKTADMYEEELTRLLQSEQYGKASKMLQFLLRLSNKGERRTEQWEALLHWLQTMAPEEAYPIAGRQDEEEDLAEEMLRRHAILSKTADNSAYIQQLLDMLTMGSMEQQMTAIEQLAFVEHSGISPVIRDWLQANRLHPHMQFKALQTLKRRGDKGYIDIPKNGARVSVDIEETPLQPDEFPQRIRDTIRRIQEISETDHPDFLFFAEQTWNDFLALAYGTSIYTDLLNQDESSVDIWACALHTVLQETLFGHADRSELIELYGITEGMLLQWKQAHQVLRKFAEAMFPQA